MKKKKKITQQNLAEEGGNTGQQSAVYIQTPDKSRRVTETGFGGRHRIFEKELLLVLLEKRQRL